MKRAIVAIVMVISLFLSVPAISATEAEKPSQPKAQPTYCQKHKTVCTITAIAIGGALIALGSQNRHGTPENGTR